MLEVGDSFVLQQPNGLQDLKQSVANPHERHSIEMPGREGIGLCVALTDAEHKRRGGRAAPVAGITHEAKKTGFLNVGRDVLPTSVTSHAAVLDEIRTCLVGGFHAD